MSFRNRFVSAIEEGLHSEYGSVFYSGDTAFSGPSPIYILGVNPGGKPVGTIFEHLQTGFTRPDWCSYLDEQWQSGKGAGLAPIQQRMDHLVTQLNLDLRSTPASNLIFVTTPSEADLGSRFTELADRCWPFHQQVIDELGVKVVICLSAKVGGYVRHKLQAHELRGTFVETNKRGWKSAWYGAKGGRSVVVLNHPSRANWKSAASDPSALVQRAILD